MAKPKPREESIFTYGDYLKTPEGVRWEIIDGIMYDMTPSPLRIHQDISGELFFRFRLFFDRKSCKVYSAPFGVRLPDSDERDEMVKNYVEPDIAVVCDRTKLDDRGCRGAPDLIVEILSPSTASKDHIKKKGLYERSGVREYWLIDPINRISTVYVRQSDGMFGVPVILDASAKTRSAIFPDLEIDFAAIFPPSESPEPIVREPPPEYSATPPRQRRPSHRKKA
jgi:Uma2 family endonuclease